MAENLGVHVFSGDQSKTKRLYNSFVRQLRQLNPQFSLREIELLESPAETVSREFLQSRFSQTPKETADLLEASGIILAFPIWNFGAPGVLKNYLDRAILPGKTFSFGATGLQSALAKKPVQILCVAGGIYDSAQSAPFAQVTALGHFLGMKVLEPIFVQGLDLPGANPDWAEIEAQVARNAKMFLEA